MKEKIDFRPKSGTSMIYFRRLQEIRWRIQLGKFTEPTWVSTELRTYFVDASYDIVRMYKIEKEYRKLIMTWKRPRTLENLTVTI